MSGDSEPSVRVVDQKGPQVTIQLSGDLTRSKDVELARQLIDKMEEGETSFIFDLSKVQHMDSIWLRVLLLCWVRLQQVNGKMVILNPSPTVLSVLNYTGFSAGPPIVYQTDENPGGPEEKSRVV